MPDILPSVCPFSGLPIRTEPDWTYRNPQGSYQTSFALIGRRIILIAAKGYVEEADMHHAISLATYIRKDIFPEDARYVTIEDFTRAQGGTVEARRLYLAFTNQLEGLLGSFVFGLPPFFRLSFNLTRRLRFHRHKVQVMANYKAAIQAALALVGEEPVLTAPGRVVQKNLGSTESLMMPDGVDRRRGQPPPLCPLPVEANFDGHVNHLLDFLGGIDPEKPGICRRREVDGGSHSPFEPVYEAIELMKFDLDQLVDAQRRTTRDLSARRDELERKSAELEQKNRDLRRFLQQNANDRHELEAGVVRNVHDILKPLMRAMAQNRPNPDQIDWLSRLTRQVDELLDSFSPWLDSERFNFTRRELVMARFIRDGFSSRQIAERLQISIRTVTTHRSKIRAKLGIRGKHRNVPTLLLAIPDGALEVEEQT